MSELLLGPFVFDDMAVKGGRGETETFGEELDLPARTCELCGEDQWHRQLARYDLGAPEGVERSLFLVSAGWRELSSAEFDLLVARFNRRADDQWELLPGIKIGHPILRFTTPPKDFISDGLVILINERVLECVRAHSIKIEVAPVDVIGAGNKRFRYFNILTPVLRLADEKWMSIEFANCPKCQQWWKKSGVGLPKEVVIDNARLVKARWPEAQGVVYSKDIWGVYYSPEFVKACVDAKLTGCGFKQVFWA